MLYDVRHRYRGFPFLCIVIYWQVLKLPPHELDRIRPHISSLSELGSALFGFCVGVSVLACCLLLPCIILLSLSSAFVQSVCN